MNKESHLSYKTFPVEGAFPVFTKSNPLQRHHSEPQCLVFTINSSWEKQNYSFIKANLWQRKCLVGL